MKRKLTRRAFLASTAGLGAAALATEPKVASRIIDTHTHFYDPTRPEGVPWPTPGTPLYRPVYPKDWLELASPHGIRETVVVEASKLVEDNDWILRLAEKEKCIVGFIGHLEPMQPGFENHLKRLARNPLFRGVRMGGSLLMDHEKPEYRSALKLMASLDLTLDVNGLRDPSLVDKIASAMPDLRIVIDHCGNCGDPRQLKPEWKSGMKAAAARPNVWCKVSALAEMVQNVQGNAPDDCNFYAPILDHLWQCFGPEKVVFGSNWPVSDKGASFATVFKIVSDYFSAKGKEACEQYFWKNSLRAYKWIERGA
ncbi:MAG: amidohydrolase family protein [Verrucomicrobiaceae bacterium]|nr:amidohydrolase family protein [Verrucomicrobiaceae bacterium]